MMIAELVVLNPCFVKPAPVRPYISPGLARCQCPIHYSPYYYITLFTIKILLDVFIAVIVSLFPKLVRVA